MIDNAEDTHSSLGAEESWREALEPGLVDVKSPSPTAAHAFTQLPSKVWKLGELGLYKRI